MYWSPAVIAGITAGAISLILIFIGLFWYYALHQKTPSNRNSETGSSDPSTLVEWNHGDRVSSAGGPRVSESRLGARQFTLHDLEQATKKFCDSNLVGTGSFGLVYKGLLLDGTVVAVKRRARPSKQEFVEEVRRLCEIWHRNLVTLIGYCQEGGYQMLVYEYLPNGSISSHLYGNLTDTSKDSVTRLEFKQRLAIAIGVAKGLAHLHGLVPPLIHKNFKTNNVLVDENFIAKVADAGIFVLIQGSHDAGPSTRNIYVDPEVSSTGRLSESSDVYSFGVFVLELISGQEASHFAFPESQSSLAQLVETRYGSDELIDSRLGTSYTTEGIKELIGLTLYCLNPNSIRRPKMRQIAVELDRILETEMSLTTVMGDGTAIVTLGSQLFTS